MSVAIEESLHYVKFRGLTAPYNRAFDTTTDAIWDGINRGVRTSWLSMIRCTNVADQDLQRQWKDIKQKYMQPAEEEGGDDEDE